MSVSAEVSWGCSAFFPVHAAAAWLQPCCLRREGPCLVLLWEKASVPVQNQVALPGVLTWVQTGTPCHPRNPVGLCWGRVHQYFVRYKPLFCRDKDLSARPLYVSGGGKFPWGLKEHGVLSISRDIFETRQCLRAKDSRAGSSCAQL